MHILINEEVREVTSDISVSLLFETLGIQSAGIAVAVNDQVIRRSDWENTLLKEQDRITVIRATCGG